VRNLTRRFLQALTEYQFPMISTSMDSEEKGWSVMGAEEREEVEKGIGYSGK
jgi:hypothetical protein